MLIGDKSGPDWIASTHGHVRPKHLARQAQRIRFRNDAAHLTQRHHSLVAFSPANNPTHVSNGGCLLGYLL
jgi:hypothetical protein